MTANDLNSLVRLDKFVLKPSAEPGSIRRGIAHVFFNDQGQPIATYMITSEKQSGGCRVGVELNHQIPIEDGHNLTSVPAGLWTVEDWERLKESLQKGEPLDVCAKSEDSSKTCGGANTIDAEVDEYSTRLNGGQR